MGGTLFTGELSSLDSMKTIYDSRDYVLAQSKANIEFIKANPASVGPAKQINAALANIVAMERNVIMHNALERSLRPNSNEGLQGLPQS